MVGSTLDLLLGITLYLFEFFGGKKLELEFITTLNLESGDSICGDWFLVLWSL